MNAAFLLAATVRCAVGCNVGAPDGQALHVLECDTETGAARLVQSVKGIQGTTYFTFDADGKWLYSTIGERKDGKRVGSLVRFAVAEGILGTMERLCALPCEAPCHVSLTADRRRIAFAAYSSATVGTCPVAGGAAQSVVLPDDAMGPNAKRQKKAYAHCAFPTPDGRRIGIVDLGCDRIWFFDPKTMRRDASLAVKADPGDGPRHAVWSKDGWFLFVVNELGNSVLSYAFQTSQTSQTFSRVGKWSTLPTGCADESYASAIKLTDDGKLLMASNRGYDSIAFFDVDTASGALTLRNIARLERSFPRDFELMPGERFMVVGYEKSNAIRIYRFDRADCTLTPVGEPISAWKPICFKFWPEGR